MESVMYVCVRVVYVCVHVWCVSVAECGGWSGSVGPPSPVSQLRQATNMAPV